MAVEQANQVDVLIVGAGPAGLMLGTWLSRLGISTRIVDKRSTKVFTGQADGVQCRTVEVFQSFGFAHRLVDEGAHINEVVFYNPSEDGGIVRTQRTYDTAPGTSRFPHAVLTQGRIERFLLDAMHGFNKLEVERATLPISFDFDRSRSQDFDAHVVEVRLQHLSDEEAAPAGVGTSDVQNGLFRSNLFADDAEELERQQHARSTGATEKIRAKFVVGCDGARSWVRKQVGLQLEGEAMNAYWGVIDAMPVTDFPDVRKKCTIHSKDSGSVLIVPRERDLVRFYVQLGSTKPGERVDRSAFSPDKIMEKARAILRPYKLECPHVDWWTVYEIGQRLSPTFTIDERVFIAGDACHTHSPKAGQGMNISMMDTYNLGWKLAAVIKGTAKPELLKTYQTERHQTAKELIDFDAKLAKMWSSKPATSIDDFDGVDMSEFKRTFIDAGKWASGTAVQYKPSSIVAEGMSLAAGLPLGMRFLSQQVVAVADARPWQICDLMPSDGRWRVVLFCGDLRNSQVRKTLDETAATVEDTVLRRFTPPNEDLDTKIEVLAVMSNPRLAIELNELPDVLWPPKLPYGVRDYRKVFADDDTYDHGHGHIYERLGIDLHHGCAVLVRPDQYVAQVVKMSQVSQIGEFLSNILVEV